MPNTVSGQYTTGFPEKNTIKSPPSSVPIYDRQFVFYSINFTCEMNISSWIFAAEINTQPAPPTTERINLELQIWRASPFFRDLQLIRQSTVGISEDPEPISGSLYRYTPNDSVTVMPGDVLGIRIAPTFGDPVTTYAPLFIDVGTGNTAEYYVEEFQTTERILIPTLENPSIAGRIGDQYIPLVTVEFGMLNICHLSPFIQSYLLSIYLYLSTCLSIHLSLNYSTGFPNLTSFLVLPLTNTRSPSPSPSSPPASRPSFSPFFSPSFSPSFSLSFSPFFSPSFSPFFYLSSSIPPMSISLITTQMTTESSETNTMIDTTLIPSSTSLTSLATSNTDTLSTLTTTFIQSVAMSTKIATVFTSHGIENYQIMSSQSNHYFSVSLQCALYYYISLTL